MVEFPGIDHAYSPRVAGTRITVYDVYYYLIREWSESAIAELFDLSVDQIQAAVRYIEANKDDVVAVHNQIEERHAKGNPPELQAKLDASHARFMEMVKERHRLRNQGGNHEGNHGGQQR